MKVDFLVFYSRIVSLVQVIINNLSIAYQGSYEEPPDNQELSMAISVRHLKEHENVEADADSEESFICGFSVDFATEDAEKGSELVKAFCEEFADDSEMGVKHLLKLNDPYLQRINQEYAAEIFYIEMRLREAISLIFLDTYGNDFYDLLKDVTVRPWGNDPPLNQMQAHWENQFFYLLFSQYPQLNARKLPSKVNDLIQLIGQVDDFDSFKQMLTSRPIKNEKYSDFLTSLKTFVDPIEKVRNSVAHNRAIPQKIINDYETAKKELLEELEQLFNDETWDDHGPVWEEEARDALESALEGAEWDIENSMVTIYNSYDERDVTCNSIDELREELEQLASDTASVCMPYDEGSPFFSYDANWEASSILEEYQKQIEELGWEL